MMCLSTRFISALLHLSRYSHDELGRKGHEEGFNRFTSPWLMECFIQFNNNNVIKLDNVLKIITLFEAADYFGIDRMKVSLKSLVESGLNIRPLVSLIKELSAVCYVPRLLQKRKNNKEHCCHNVPDDTDDEEGYSISVEPPLNVLMRMAVRRLYR